jgi:hypothetical protein
MALFRDIKLNTGTVNDRFGAVGTVSGSTFSQNEKGQAISIGANDARRIQYNETLLPSGAFTVVVWSKNVRIPSTNARDFISANLGAPGLGFKIAGGDTTYYGNNRPSIGLNNSNTNNRVFNYTNNDFNWHCYIYTVPGNAQSDITNSQLFVDNISIPAFSTVSSGVQASRNGFIYVTSNGANTEYSVSRIKVYDHVLSQAEINAEYEEFLNAQPINKAKRGFTMPNKPTDLSSQVNNTIGTNLAAGYDFTNWTTTANATVNSSNTFTTTISGRGIFRNLGMVGNRRYRIVISGTTTSASGLNITDGSGTVTGFTLPTGAFNQTLEGVWTNGNFNLYIQNVTAGVTTIDTFQVQEIAGLVGAWNMVKNGNLLVDVSGGGRNATTEGLINSTANGIQISRGASRANLSTALTPFGTGNYSISARLMFADTVTTDAGVIGAAGGGLNIYRNAGLVVGKAGINDIPLGVTTAALSVGSFITLNIVRTGTTVNTYVNGVLAGTATDANDYTVGIGTLFARSTTGTTGFGGTVQDMRVHNRALSVTEIIQYHNSFVQPTVIDDLSDAGADNITKSVAPMREWERLTGTWKIDENVISNSPIYTSNFSAGVDSWAASLGGSVTAPVTIGGLSNVLEYTISGGSNFHVAQRTVSTVLGGRYTVTGKIYFPSSGNTNGFQIASTDGVTVYGTFTPVTQDTWYDFTLTYTARGSTPNSFRIIPLVNGSTPFSNDGQKYYIRDINIIQVPQLETMVNGTKYLECMSNGMIAIPCNTAYGSWEWDWYIGSTGNTRLYQFAVNSNKIGYAIIITSATALGIFDTASGTLNSSANSYITANTWYRLRLTRSASGVFTTLIKGGAFTPTAGQNGWTLVSVTGGSGTNPLTSTTYSTSQYFIVDIKVSDRFANLVVNNGIKQ